MELKTSAVIHRWWQWSSSLLHARQFHRHTYTIAHRFSSNYNERTTSTQQQTRAHIARQQPKQLCSKPKLSDKMVDRSGMLPFRHSSSSSSSYFYFFIAFRFGLLRRALYSSCTCDSNVAIVVCVLRMPVALVCITNVSMYFYDALV